MGRPGLSRVVSTLRPLPRVVRFPATCALIRTAATRAAMVIFATQVIAVLGVVVLKQHRQTIMMVAGTQGPETIAMVLVRPARRILNAAVACATGHIAVQIHQDKGTQGPETIAMVLVTPARRILNAAVNLAS